jgi:uncharacterized membrane protein
LRHMQIIPGWHPIVVHFATACSVTGGLALLAARFLPGRRGARRSAVLGTLNLVIGAGFCLLAIASGIAAVWEVQLGPAARAALSLHVKWAFFTTLSVLLLAVWRAAGAAPEEPPSNVLVAVALAVLTAVAVTAYLGAENVYRHGIGVLANGG